MNELLLAKCKRVISSCKTVEQLDIAVRYIKLARADNSQALDLGLAAGRKFGVLHTK